MKIKQAKYQIVIIFTLSVYLYYLIYRLRYTINPDALFLSISFYYADVHGFISLLLFFFQIWKPTERKSPLPSLGLSVDIYIPTYNEDLSLLRKTALGCVNIRYPHKTYILDDGNRPELAKEALSWGCEYIARSDKSGAKAGNLNHALQVTKGEFVAIFDADCVPLPDFLDRTIGYFQDQKVAFVQTPSNYYNVDSFQLRVNMEKEKYWNEQNLFYKVMMPGRDYWNASFFAGTAGIFRKEALEDIGGFSTESITEDLQTTIHLYSSGWKGVYHKETLSNELAAIDLKNYHTQKHRWAEGNISMFFTCNPLLKKGLTIPQRICFFSTIFGWLFGFPKLIYLIVPPIAIITGMNPIQSFDLSFLWRCLFFLAVIVFGFEFVSRGYGKIAYWECFNTMNFLVVTKAAFRSIFALFGLKSIFKVTRKDTNELISISEIIPQVILCLLCFLGAVWGILKMYYGLSVEFAGIGIALLWNSINGSLAFSVIERTTRPHHKRKDFRFIGAIPVQYSREETSGLWDNLGVTKDINSNGISLVTFTPLPANKKISLSLHLGQKVLSSKGTVLYRKSYNIQNEKIFIHGVKFEELSQEDKDMINRYCFNTILPRFFHRFDQKPSSILKILFKVCNQERFRRHTRKKIPLPLVIHNSENTSLTTATHDISSSGLSFFTDYIPLKLGEILIMSIVTPFGTLHAKGKIRQIREVLVGHSYFIGVEFIEFQRFRKHGRRTIALPLVIQRIQQNRKVSFTTVTHDISLSGLSLISNIPLELKTVLTLKVITPFGTLAIKGEIRQTKATADGHSYLIGVRFIQLLNHSEDASLDRSKGVLPLDSR